MDVIGVFLHLVILNSSLDQTIHRTCPQQPLAPSNVKIFMNFGGNKMLINRFCLRMGKPIPKT